MTVYAGRIAKNTAFLLAGSIVAQILLAVQGILIARSVGPVEYGYYATAMAFVGLFSGLLVLGLDSLMAREIARSPQLAGQALASGAAPGLIFSVLVVGFMCLVVQFVGYSPITKSLVTIVGFTQVVLGLSNLVRGVFRGFEKMGFDAGTRAAHAVLGLAFAGMGLLLYGSIQAVALFLFCAGLLGLIFAVVILARKTPIKGFRIDTKLSQSLLRAAVPIGLSQALVAGYVRLDSVLLSLCHAETQVGLYTVAFTLTMAWMPIPLALSNAMFPQLANSFKSNISRFLSIYETGLRYLVIIGLPIAICMSVLADPILGLLYGDSFTAGAPALRILGWAIVVLFLNTLLSNVLVAIDQQKLLVRVTVSNIVVSLVLGFILIPRLGTVGAASVVLAREVTNLVLQGYYVSRFVGRPRARDVFVPSFAAGGGLTLLLLMSVPYVGPWLGMVLGGLAYFALQVAMGGIRREELFLLQRWLRRWSPIGVRPGARS